MKFRAALLNYRDLLFARGIYNPNAQFPAVPFCDGAGEVVAVGEHVTRWKVGERVSPIYFQGWLEGEHSAQKDRTAIGGGHGAFRLFVATGATDDEVAAWIGEHAKRRPRAEIVV